MTPPTHSAKSLTRRSLLGGIGTLGLGAAAGCVTGGRLRRYRVRNDPAPDSLPATVTAEAIGTPTRERPLLLRITFESTASEPTAFAIEPPGAFPFGRTAADNLAPPPTDAENVPGPRRVVLTEADAGDLVDMCWTAPGAEESPADGTGDHRVRLSPGDSVSVERVVLNHESNVACYPLGRYRFTEAFRVGEAASSDGGPSVSWGFSIEISDLRPQE